jgi:hypothetical protein
MKRVISFYYTAFSAAGMSRLTPAIPRRAIEQARGDALFRRKLEHQGSLWGCGVCPFGLNPSNCGQRSEVKDLLKDRAKKWRKGRSFE